MEIVHQPTFIREDRGLLVLTHLSQLLHYIIGFGGLIAPLIAWQVNKDRVEDMDEHGKSILNFQLSLLVYSVLSIPAILLFGLGLLGIAGILIVGFVFPIINAVKAGNGQKPNYYISIPFIS